MFNYIKMVNLNFCKPRGEGPAREKSFSGATIEAIFFSGKRWDPFRDRVLCIFFKQKNCQIQWKITELGNSYKNINGLNCLFTSFISLKIGNWQYTQGVDVKFETF